MSIFPRYIKQEFTVGNFRIEAIACARVRAGYGAADSRNKARERPEISTVKNASTESSLLRDNIVYEKMR